VRNSIIFLLTILFVASATNFGQSEKAIPTIAPSKAGRKVESPYYRTLIRVPNSSGIVAYEGLDSEQIPRGPVSLSVTSEGTFVVGNQVENSALEIARTGTPLHKVNFNSSGSIGDVVKINGEYYALDRSEGQATIVASSALTNETRQVALAPSDASRFSGSDLGSSWDGGISVTTVEGLEKNGFGGDTIERRDGLRVSSANPFQEDPNRVRVWRGENLLVDYRADYPVAESRILGSIKNGDFFLMTLELVGRQSLIFDQRVLRFNSNGELIGQTRIPQEQTMPLVNDTALSAEGDVYVMMPRAESLDILQLNFLKGLEPIVVKEEGNADSRDIPSQNIALASITRSQIAASANNYINSSAYINNTSINGACSGRVKPRYLGTAGWYPSVSYSWGGGDGPGEFAGKMNLSKPAGHASGSYAACSPTVALPGVDCSGAVAREWGLGGGHPFGTSTVVSGGYASVIDWTMLRTGDALVWKDHHIMLFDASADTNNAYVWEATTDPDSRGYTDRVVYHTRTWSYLRSSYPYQPIRYTGLSYTNPSAGFWASTDAGISTEGTTAYYNVSPGGSKTFTFDSSRSRANAGSIDGRYWTIDGTLRSYSPSFSYTLGKGTHNVSLEITNTDGGRSVANATIVINEVQIVTVPTLAGYTWSSTPYANQAFGGTVTGTGFVIGGTRVFFCIANSTTCYEQPPAGINVTSSTKLTLSNVRLSAGYWQSYVQTSAGKSGKSTNFYVR
jgi:hypothetical protein